MACNDDHDMGEGFSKTTSGASKSFPMQCSALRKGGYCLIKSKPCKIVEMSTSKTGKHGHAKVHLVGLDIFTNKKLEDICPSTHNMEVPNVSRKEYEVVHVDDGFFHLMDDMGDMREDLKITDACQPVNTEEALLKYMADASDNNQTVMATVMSAMETELVLKVEAKSGKSQ